MQLVIDVDDNLYNTIKDNKYEVYNSRIYDIIRNGTSLQEGHWIGRKEVDGEWKDFIVFVNSEGCVTDDCRCSECGDWLTGSDEYDCPAKYCPNCGAKMKMEE